MGRDDGQARHLTGAGDVDGGDEGRDARGQAHGGGHEAEAYGHRRVAQGDGHGVLEALNKVRNRVEMPAARSEYVGSKEAFRNYVRNERCVELAYESAHYYFDIRRWKIAPETMKQTLYGMYVEKCSPSAAYPDGKKFVRRAIPSNRQCTWKDYMYVLPLPDSQANTMKDFVNNQKWQ